VEILLRNGMKQKIATDNPTRSFYVGARPKKINRRQLIVFIPIRQNLNLKNQNHYALDTQTQT
jgi:hypothetical protein